MADVRLVRDLQLSESCRLIAYRDTKGLWTIGWGHLLDPRVDWTDHAITQATADSLLTYDIEVAEKLAASLPEWGFLDSLCRQNAVIELCFNMGRRWLGFQKTRAAVERKDWQTAHDELLDSDWADEVGPTRANRLANYLLAGVYP